MFPPPTQRERTCRGGSLWDTADGYLPDPTGPKAAERQRAAEVEGRLIEMLMDHGVEPQDAHLLLPLPWQLRTALRRQQVRETDAALHADPTVCDMRWRGCCPAHGHMLRWSRWRRVWHCRERGCSHRVTRQAWWRHCDQPAVEELPVPGGDPGERERVCAGHREDQLLVLAGRELRGIEQPALSSPSGDDPHDEATK